MRRNANVPRRSKFAITGRLGSHFRVVLVGGLGGFCAGGPGPAGYFGGNPDSYAFIRIPSDTDDWTRHFRIGALAGMNISANFSRNGTFGISGNNPAQGIYANGYVRTDNTGNAGGQTAYWGYNNSTQLNGTALNDKHARHQLIYHQRQQQGAGGIFPGFDMAYGDNLWYWKHARVGWELGFGLLPIDITDNQSAPATVNQSTYTFNTGGIIVPGAPYQGLPKSGAIANHLDQFRLQHPRPLQRNRHRHTINGRMALHAQIRADVLLGFER